MTYQEAINAARRCTSYDEVDTLLRAIEEEYDTISDRQYYSIKNVAINAAYVAMTK